LDHLIGQEKAVFIPERFIFPQTISFGVDPSHNGFSLDVAKFSFTSRTGYQRGKGQPAWGYRRGFETCFSL